MDARVDAKKLKSPEIPASNTVWSKQKEKP